MVICKYRPHSKRTVLKWYNPVTWVKRIWEKLTASSGNEGHSILSSILFCGMLLGIWLWHILFSGWYNHFFKPTMWVGTREQVKEGFIDTCYDRVWCKLASEAIRCNNNGDVIKIVMRTNAIFLGVESIRIYSPNYNAYDSGR